MLIGSGRIRSKHIRIHEPRSLKIEWGTKTPIWDSVDIDLDRKGCHETTLYYEKDWILIEKRK